ncbi:hypothetical protein HDE_04008 [Halotydeus destructor]|nr:hypothetical protein HDE_04008 [Halotydeus destructor]
MAESGGFQRVRQMLTLEPYLFFVFLAFFAKQNTYSQLFQDKICVTTYGLSSQVCNFVTSSKDGQYQEVKTAILKDANDLSSYQFIIRTVPGIIFTILLAPWADKVKGARRKLMIWSALGQIVDSALGIICVMYEDTLPPWTALIVGIPSSLVGGTLAINVSTFGYASMTTSLADMSLRFLIFEAVKNSCRPSSSFLSGQLLDTPSWMPNKVRNFTALYTFAMVSGLLALVWSLRFIDDSDWKKTDMKDEEYQLLNKENMIQLTSTLTRKRENQGHIQLWLLLFINCLVISIPVAATAVTLSFVQEVYGWNFTDFSNASSFLASFTFIAFAVGSPVLTKKLNLSDSQLGIFGALGGFLFMLTMGTVLSPWGFYAATILGTYANVAGSAVKSSVSKLVEPNEKSSAIALLSVFQNASTLAFTWYFRITLNYTITSMPGLCFQLASIFSLVAVLGFVWIDYNILPAVKSEKKRL